MSEITFNELCHMEYILGTTNFEKQSYDIYVGMTSRKGPPFLDEMISETTQMEALRLLKGEGVLSLSQLEQDQYYHDVWNNEEYAKMEVMDKVSADYYDSVCMDLLHFFTKNRLSILVRKGLSQDKKDSRLYHSPVSDVW